MPIYEYECKGCRHQFEFLLLQASKAIPACPECQSEDLEKLMSGFGFKSAELTKARVKAARKQVAESKDFKDKKIAEHEYEHHHHH